MNLNHEKLENGELTNMIQTTRGMIAQSSQKSTLKVEGKMEVF